MHPPIPNFGYHSRYAISPIHPRMGKAREQKIAREKNSNNEMKPLLLFHPLEREGGEEKNIE